MNRSATNPDTRYFVLSVRVADAGDSAASQPHANYLLDLGYLMREAGEQAAMP